MELDVLSISRLARVQAFAAISLAIAVSTGSAIAIANADTTHRAGPDAKAKTCSASTPCFEWNNSANGVAINGNGTNNSGVFGNSQTYYGVYGQAAGTFAGVGGFSIATATGASGVYGSSTNGYGVYGFTGSSSGYGLVSQGNAFVEGQLYTSGACKNGCTKTRQQAAFAARTSQPTIDDVGEAVLRMGVARVPLAADFANVIDSSKPYVVLLTPEGEAQLYVANRTSTGFEVRQMGGGHSSVAFPYRIVAKPYGAADERLPFKAVANPMSNR